MQPENYTRGEVVTVNGIKFAVIKSLGGQDWKLRALSDGKFLACHQRVIVRLAPAPTQALSEALGQPLGAVQAVSGPLAVLKAGAATGQPIDKEGQAAPAGQPTPDPAATKTATEENKEEKSYLQKLIDKQ